MVVVFTISKIIFFMVSLFFNLVRPLLYICGTLAALCALLSALRQKHLWLSRIQLLYSSTTPLGQVIFKQNIL